MVVLYHPGLDPTRVYEGTDTRAFGLLIGAMLALAWPKGAERGTDSATRPASRWMRVLLDAAGLAGLAAIGLMIWRVGQYSPFAYRGGLVLLPVSTAAALAPPPDPARTAGRAPGGRP